MFEEVVAYLVLAPIAGGLLAVLGWIGWTCRSRPAAVPLEKDRLLSD